MRDDPYFPPPGAPTCHGCKHCWYSAPGGQAWNRQPHSRCTALARDIVMVLAPKTDKWLESQIPGDCPVYFPQAKPSTRQRPNPRPCGASLIPDAKESR